MTSKDNAHSEGFYRKYPEVTWDLAEERWLGTSVPNSRSDVLIGMCSSCGWSDAIGPVLTKPERRLAAEFLLRAQHWYQCPGVPQVESYWLGELEGKAEIQKFPSRSGEDPARDTH